MYLDLLRSQKGMGTTDPISSPLRQNHEMSQAAGQMAGRGVLQVTLEHPVLLLTTPSGCRFGSIHISKEMVTAKQGWSKIILGVQALKTR